MPFTCTQERLGEKNILNSKPQEWKSWFGSIQ